MTKAELIELLKDIPSDTKLVIRGHSDGDAYNELSLESLCPFIVYRYEDPGWAGEFHEPFQNYPEGNDGEPITVICLD